MKLWTVTKNTDEGITTSIHLTEEAAVAAKTAFVKEDWQNHYMGDFPGLEVAADQLSDTVGYMDSYDLEGHEVTIPVAELPLPDWVADFIKRRTEVEHALRVPFWSQQKGLPMPAPMTPEQLWALANKLSIPSDVTAYLAKAQN